MDPTIEQINAALRQYLRGLGDAGIESIPKGSGRFSLLLNRGPELEEASFDRRNVESARATEVRVEESKVDYSAAALSANRLGNSKSAADVKHQESARSALHQTPLSSLAVPSSLVDATAYPPSLSLAQRESELSALSATVQGCTKCKELARCRNKVVFGVGTVTPRLVFLGEAPGADEDRVGEPFVGAAGQLLNKIINACQWNRGDVYILNTIKCRPPGNRNPAPEELDQCWAFTQRQLEILRPEFICCLGLIATKQLLKTTQPLGQLRQKIHRYRESRVMVTYHPAYLLRTESAKKHVWEDMKMLMQEMGTRSNP